MINAAHVVRHVIRPVHDALGFPSLSSDVLSLSTALIESRLTHLYQIPNGPAEGMWQMEPATHDDIHDNYLRYRGDLRGRLQQFTLGGYTADQMRGNLYYAAAMARIHYRRVPEALPRWDDDKAMALYHKKYYNTHLGKTRVDDSVVYCRKAIRIIKELDGKD